MMKAACAMRWRATLFFVLLTVAGCAAPISVERVDARTAYRAETANALDHDGLSGATRNLLRQRLLLEPFDADPEGTIAALHASTMADPHADAALFALAEMSYLHARRGGGRPYYFASAVYAYAFLFPGANARPPQPFDPRLRTAADFYNFALTAALKSDDGTTIELRSERQALPFGTLDIGFDARSLDWGRRRLTNFVPASELAIEGLNNRYRQPGLGAALAAATVSPAPEHGFQVAPKVRVAASAFLHIPDARRQLADGRIEATLSVHTMFDAMSVPVAGQRVPLQYEPSAALALGLAESDVWSREYRGFLSGDLLETAPTQLIAIEPHRPGRIPVVFVHGTASSVGRWADMLNDLRDDPVIDRNFEFWFFSYTTGNPIPYSALLLRESLQDAVEKLSRNGADPALGEMVLIGHSQGGLLVKMQVIDPGTRLWDAISRKPIDALDVSDDTRDLLRRALLVRPVPQVRRVVFIATPHRGSYVAAFSVARWVQRLVTLPLDIARLGVEVLKGNAEALAFDPETARLGSIYGMSPGSPFLRALEAIPIVPDVRVNSIIPVLGDGPAAEGDDGVVKYSSAHLDGVESELVVRSGHSTQSYPPTIEEVRRILLRHLAEACPALPACARSNAVAAR